MTLAEIREFHRCHWRKPWVWTVIFAMSVTEFIAAALSGGSWKSHPVWWLALFLAAGVLSTGSAIILGPWAWLWTGRSGTYPGLRRGLLQVLLFGCICFLAVAFCDLAMRATQVRHFGLPKLWRLLDYMTLFGLGGYGISAFEREFRARSMAESQAQEAQWILLKGQMNPHAFFNAMNNLTELIRKDPRLAERIAMNLSDMFRRLSDHGQRHLTPLGEERQLVESYLNLESLRLGNRLEVVWKWEAALDEVLAPPFLLQPLVENAIKHALAPNPSGGLLRITGALGRGQVHLRVDNTGKALGQRNSGGSGLDNLESRLHLAFKGEARFDLFAEDGWTAADLRFPVIQESA